MTRALTITITLALIVTSPHAFGQKDKLEEIALTPKKKVAFSLDYKITRPTLQYPYWNRDFDQFYAFLTPLLRKTQATLSHTDNGVVSTFTPNSIIPHAQLDTTTITDDKEKFVGTWRMLTYRSIRFNDSVNIPTKTYYRLADTLLDDKSNDEVFAILTDGHFTLYAKEQGKQSFKKELSSKYKIENKRFIMLYKLSKASAGVSQIGIDENGYLIMNYPKVIENIKKGEYFSYYAIVEQYIFERVKE